MRQVPERDREQDIPQETDKCGLMCGHCSGLLSCRATQGDWERDISDPHPDDSSWSLISCSVVRQDRIKAPSSSFPARGPEPPSARTWRLSQSQLPCMDHWDDSGSSTLQLDQDTSGWTVVQTGGGGDGPGPGRQLYTQTWSQSWPSCLYLCRATATSPVSPLSFVIKTICCFPELLIPDTTGTPWLMLLISDKENIPGQRAAWVEENRGREQRCLKVKHGFLFWSVVIQNTVRLCWECEVWTEARYVNIWHSIRQYVMWSINQSPVTVRDR